MLLAEDLLLLLTDDVTGKARLDATRLDLVLAGAVLLDLGELGRIDVAGEGEAVRPGRMVVRDTSPTGDDVLDEALRRIVERRPSKPQDLLPKLVKGLRTALLQRLAGRGLLRAEESRVLGVFPVRRWPAVDATRAGLVRRGLTDAVVVGRTPAPREAALVSLLHAVDQVPTVLKASGVEKRELKRRAKAIAEGDFAGTAVRKAVEAVNAAVLASVVAAGAVAAAGSSG